MAERQPGLDLIRVLALLLVVSFHAFLYNGYYHEAQQGVSMWLAGSFRWLSVACNGLFLMLSGYLGGRKTSFSHCRKTLLRVLLGYLLAAVISIPIRHFFLGDTQSFATWFRRIFTFRAVYYGWYVEMFLGLTLLSPFLGLLLERLQKPGELLSLVLVLLVLTALPGATTLDLAPDHWRILYPVTYYVLGAAVYRLQPRIHLLAGLGLTLLVALSLGAVTTLSTDGKLSEAFIQEFGDLWIVVMVLAIFCSLYRIPVGRRMGRLLRFAAGGCYGGYLLSHLLDSWVYAQFPKWRTPGGYIWLFFLVTVPVFLVSILSGRLLEDCTGWLLRRRKEAVTWGQESRGT